MDTTNLKVYLPFDDSTTQDLCGGSWTATGNPTIQDGKLYLNGESYLQLDGGVTLGGQDFTICCKAKMDSNGWYDGLFSANNKQIRICGVERYTDRLLIAIKNNEKTVTGLDLTFPFHVEIDYQHSTGIWRVFFNGNLIRSYTSSRSRTTYSTFLIGSNGDPDPNAKYWHGSIDEFQIYDGVALHTENFTPPTADEYTALKLALGGSAPVVLNCDVERKVAAPVQVNFDVQRVLWQKWFYYNAGSADTLTISGTTLINLPATKSKTGSAF
ncbi:MAG: LamG domain-containing protein, partial [Selenomonadaceae bacterium]|nr:LamG domain-containing protein [Selenomonadaceae bacterium]